MCLLKDSVTKVTLTIDIDKLKAEKRLTAKVCCVDGCGEIGRWDSKLQGFYLIKGMCNAHYIKLYRFGDPLVGKSKEQYFDGRIKNPAYNCFNSMIQRCENENSASYQRYGAIGITVSEEFHDFRVFLEHIGERPSMNHSIDRYPDKAGNYERGNIRWATPHMQNGNQKSNNETVGVGFDKFRNKHIAYLQIDNKLIRRRFDTELEAISQRKAWDVEYGITY